MLRAGPCRTWWSRSAAPLRGVRLTLVSVLELLPELDWEEGLTQDCSFATSWAGRTRAGGVEALAGPQGILEDCPLDLETEMGEAGVTRLDLVAQGGQMGGLEGTLAAMVAAAAVADLAVLLDPLALLSSSRLLQCRNRTPPLCLEALLLIGKVPLEREGTSIWRCHLPGMWCLSPTRATSTALGACCPRA